MALPRGPVVAERACGGTGGGRGEGVLLHAAGAQSGRGLALHQVATLTTNEALGASSSSASVFAAAANRGSVSRVQNYTAEGTAVQL
jgi:hypothetical protein